MLCVCNASIAEVNEYVRCVSQWHKKILYFGGQDSKPINGDMEITPF